MTALRELANAYLYRATPFAIAHLAILIVVCYRIARIEILRRQVLAWQPESAQRAKPNNKIVGLLNEFVASVRELGTRGEQVSASEHLQRIADATERRETHLNDAIHAFLLIGIAGTLFGLYSFATTASTLKGENVPLLMGPLLSDSMAKAFPVAFAGLVLMVVFQFISSTIESRFDFAIEQATQRVLALRRKLTVSQSSLAYEAVNSIRESMKPMQNLQVVLEQSLQPVIISFKDGLKEAISLVQAQSSEVNGYVARLTDVEEAFRGAAAQVTTTTQALRQFGETISGRLDAVMQESRALIKLSTDLTRLSEFQQTKLADLSRSFEVDLQSAAKLTDRVDDIRELVASTALVVSDLPTRVQATLAAEVPEAIHAAALKLTKEWLHDTRRLSREMVSGSQEAITGMSTRLTEAAGHLRLAVDDWKRLERNYESLIKLTLKDALGEALKSNKSLLTETEKVVATTVQQFGMAHEQLTKKLEEGMQAFAKWLIDVENEAFRISTAASATGQRPVPEAVERARSSLHGQILDILREVSHATDQSGSPKGAP